MLFQSMAMSKDKISAAAKKAARQQLARDGQLYPGSGKKQALNKSDQFMLKILAGVFFTTASV